MTKYIADIKLAEQEPKKLFAHVILNVYYSDYLF